MFDSNMMQNLQEMREVAERHHKLLVHVFNDSIGKTFGKLTKKQLDLSAQCLVAEKAVLSIDDLLKVNQLLADLIEGKDVSPSEYGEF